MTPERWLRISGLLDAALELSEAGRAEFLAGLADDERVEVESLLAHASEATTSGPMRAIAGVAREALADVDGAAWIGRRLGPWRLVSVLGVGGMGVVFAAEHREFAKRAAIKLVRQTLRDPWLLARFRQERQILARLEHPNVARLYDGDAIDGQPYLVMEHVDGMPLLAWCDAQAAALDVRLRLFVAICAAVEHAHRNLVIHRDLKPSNILVTADGQPKLLDFGIAKLLDDEAPGAQTATRDRMMTPEYASPEQVRGDPVTTATDVYALGAILSELLTGVRAQPVRSAADLYHVVCEAPARRPSAVVGRSRRGLARALAGDLDTVVLTALRKEPERRYASVAALAEDVRRHLEHRPVAARPDTLRYRWGKFVRRNLLAVGLAGLVLVSLVGGLAVALTLARAQAEAAARAERRFAEVRQLANTFLFEFDAAIARVPGTTTARELVTRTAQTYLAGLQSEAGDDPALLGELATAFAKLGDIQGMPDLPNLGRHEQALASYASALALRRRLVALDPGDRAARRALAETLTATGRLHAQLRDDAAARAAVDEAVATAQALVDAPPVATEDLDALGHARMELGALVRDTGDFAGAATQFASAAAVQRRALAAAPGQRREEALARTLERLARVQMMSGALTDALAVALEVERMREAAVARDPTDGAARRLLLATHNLLATLYFAGDGPSLDDPTSSLRHAEQQLALADELAASDPDNTTAAADLVRALMAVGGVLAATDPARAVAPYERALQVGERVSAGWEREFVRALVTMRLAVALRRLGRVDEASARLGEARAAVVRLEAITELENYAIRAFVAGEAALLAATRGQVALARSLHDEALAAAEGSVETLPDDLEERDSMNRLLEQAARFEAEQARPERACALRQRRVAAWTQWHRTRAPSAFTTKREQAAVAAAASCAAAPAPSSAL